MGSQLAPLGFSFDTFPFLLAGVMILFYFLFFGVTCSGKLSLEVTLVFTGVVGFAGAFALFYALISALFLLAAALFSARIIAAASFSSGVIFGGIFAFQEQSADMFEQPMILDLYLRLVISYRRYMQGI